uniref:Uncharacterized protein n=1 Tax=Lepeophtheirus salmonis TaxID=72036 RepID=A0A0K2VBH6_LEPSM
MEGLRSAAAVVTVMVSQYLLTMALRASGVGTGPLKAFLSTCSQKVLSKGLALGLYGAKSVKIEFKILIQKKFWSR